MIWFPPQNCVWFYAVLLGAQLEQLFITVFLTLSLWYKAFSEFPSWSFWEVVTTCQWIIFGKETEINQRRLKLDLTKTYIFETKDNFGRCYFQVITMFCQDRSPVIYRTKPQRDRQPCTLIPNVKSGSPIKLTYMSLDCGRKVEHLEKNYTGTGTSKTPHKNAVNTYFEWIKKVITFLFIQNMLSVLNTSVFNKTPITSSSPDTSSQCDQCYFEM